MHKKLQHISLGFQTNGSLLEKFATALSEPDDLRLSISFNGPTPELYRRVHEQDDFEKVCNGIRKIKGIRAGQGKDTKVELKMIYMRSNYKEAYRLAELARDLEVQGLRFVNLLIYKQATIEPREQIQTDEPEWNECVQIFERCKSFCEEHGIGFGVRYPHQKREKH